MRREAIEDSRWTWLVRTAVDINHPCSGTGPTLDLLPPPFAHQWGWACKPGVGRLAGRLPRFPPRTPTQNQNAFASVPNTMAHTEAQAGTHGAPLSPAPKTKGTPILSVGMASPADAGRNRLAISRHPAQKQIAKTHCTLRDGGSSSMFSFFPMHGSPPHRARPPERPAPVQSGRHQRKNSIEDALQPAADHKRQRVPPPPLPKVHSANRQMPEAPTNTSTRLRSG